MPTVNVFYRNSAHENALSALAGGPLQERVAEELTCPEIKLATDEVSVRLLRALGKGMLAPVEMDIIAADFPERVERQDEICRNVRQFVLGQIPELYDAKIWLSLNELGHNET